MPAILHGPPPRRTMTVDAGELIDWYSRVRRELPWRAAGVDAWQILVSEVMLQQTPVARVAPIWTDWVTRWPTAAATAAGTAGDLLRAWGKLGYPRRALRLHEAAGIVVAEFGGVLPTTVEALQTLPGVGGYTARAVACFAYGAAVPVVDTNVRRVVARAVGGRAEAGPPAAARDHAEVAALLPGDDIAPVFSAALMELGALVCTARTPDCGGCPLSACAWRDAGYPAASGPKRPAQRYTGTDRQARGRLLDVLRADAAPVTRAALDVAWPADPAQSERALATLLADGLVVALADGRFALPG